MTRNHDDTVIDVDGKIKSHSLRAMEPASACLPCFRRRLRHRRLRPAATAARPATQTCPDGSVILATGRAQPPPPPASAAGNARRARQVTVQLMGPPVPGWEALLSSHEAPLPSGGF